MMSFYESPEDVEDTTRYCAGGYHPITIDAKIYDRYRVLHKLGYGSYSTVWLVQDEQKKQKLLSMKVLTANASAEAKVQTESGISRRLHQKSSWLSGVVGRFSSAVFRRRTAPQDFVLSVLKEFEIEGPNGRHRCIITDVLGPTVDAIRADCIDYRLPLSIAKRVSSQFAEGLAYIHSRGVVHGGMFFFFFFFFSETFPAG
jgi:serine/threonine-protein kinase SRPK3